MPRMTNPDNGMMESQQAADAGRPADTGDTPALAGVGIASPIPRLPDGVDADGMVERAHAMPDDASEEAREAAIRSEAEQPTSGE